MFVSNSNNSFCCCLKHDYFKAKCHNLHNCQLILVSVQKTIQISVRIFTQTRVIVDGAKFSRYITIGQCYLLKRFSSFTDIQKINFFLYISMKSEQKSVCSHKITWHFEILIPFFCNITSSQVP